MSLKLEEVVCGDQSGFELRFCYYLQVKNSSMGFFPGIVEDTNAIILVLDPDLLAPIWERMDPKASEFVKGLFFVNKQTGVAFSMDNARLEELLSLEPWQILSREEFERITANGARPFRWAPGIFGAVIGQDEFERLRERELRKLAV